jgi:hypothetical protein
LATARCCTVRSTATTRFPSPTANKNFSFLGWKAAAKDAPYLPTGDYVATTASLVIDRTAKPAANTKTSTTLVGVTEDTTYYAVFESYPEVFLAVSATDASGATPTGKGAGKYVAGTVTGMGKYAPGKKVTVKATAAKSATTTYVHSGWYNGETLLSRAASYTFEMPAGDVALTAKFITATEDADGVSAVLDGAFDAQAYIYFPPKSGKFAGCCECVSLRWNGTAFE